MRILVLSDLYPALFLGRHELNCAETVGQLSARGDEITVLTSRWGVDRAGRRHNVCRWLHFDPNTLSLRGERRSGDTWPLRRRCSELEWAFKGRRNYAIAGRVVEQVRPDLASAWNMKKVGIHPALAAQDCGVPVVYHLADYWLGDLEASLCVERGPLRRRYRAAISGLYSLERLDLSHMLVCSASLRQHHVDLGFPAAKMTVVAPGIASRLVLPRESLSSVTTDGEGSAKFVFVGRLVPEKGAETAITALAHLTHDLGTRDCSLDIIGAGPPEYVSSLRELVERLGLAQRVKFRGQARHHELMESYAQYFALLFTPRWEEPFGMTILEAMARGLPVIAVRRGAARTVIADGENGLLVEADDPSQLAAAAHRLVSDPALAHRIRLAGLDTVAGHYTLDRVADRVEGYLFEVAQKASSPARLHSRTPCASSS